MPRELVRLRLRLVTSQGPPTPAAQAEAEALASVLQAASSPLLVGLLLSALEAIKAKIKSPTDSLRKRTQETKMEEAETHEVSDEAQAKILREVRIAAGRLGRLTLWGADMWIKDQYVDIFCRWVYLPLYAILAAISLNEST